MLPRWGVGPRVVKLSRRLERRKRSERRLPADVSVETVGEISVRIHHPPSDTVKPFAALLWIHGGGFIIGSAKQDDRFCRLVARELGVLVAAVDYRLAPEHPFPTPLHDCHDALEWLASRSDVDANAIAIGGGSAGGGLAAGLALLARDRGVVTPVLQLLAYPMLDDRTALRSDLDERNMRLWNNKANNFGWTSYLGASPGTAGMSGLASPARHDDLTRLAPAWIGIGTLDLFYDENVAYADRLRAAGVACHLHVADGAFHAFDLMRPKAAVSQRFRASQLDALRVLHDRTGDESGK